MKPKGGSEAPDEVQASPEGVGGGPSGNGNVEPNGHLQGFVNDNVPQSQVSYLSDIAQAFISRLLPTGMAMDSFIRLFSETNLRALVSMKSPVMVEDPLYPNHFTIIDQCNSLDHCTTYFNAEHRLRWKGLDLLSDRLQALALTYTFSTWLKPETRTVVGKSALYLSEDSKIECVDNGWNGIPGVGACGVLRIKKP